MISAEDRVELMVLRGYLEEINAPAEFLELLMRIIFPESETEIMGCPV